MNKKGFVFIEMIITTVVLLIALLVLYKVYNRAINDEKKRLYFDDISYIYKSELVRDIIIDSIDYNNFYKNVNNNSNGYVYLFGTESDIWQSDKVSTFGTGATANTDKNIRFLWEAYNIGTMGYIKIADIPKIKKCLNNSSSLSGEDATMCSKTKAHISAYSESYMLEYLKTLDVFYEKPGSPEPYTYEGHEAILIFKYNENKHGDNRDKIIQNSGSTYSEQFSYDFCIQSEASKSIYPYRERAEAALEGRSATESEIIKRTIAEYRKDDNVSFDMMCQSAYHLVWVYF